MIVFVKKLLFVRGSVGVGGPAVLQHRRRARWGLGGALHKMPPKVLASAQQIASVRNQAQASSRCRHGGGILCRALRCNLCEYSPCWIMPLLACTRRPRPRTGVHAVYL